jgi:tetratricopeptide (TPR) repeat protein
VRILSHLVWIAFFVLCVWAKASTDAKKGVKKTAPKSSATASAAPETEGYLLDYMKGRQLVLDGSYEEAIPYFEKALKQDPDGHQIQHELSEIYLRTNNLDKAEELAKMAADRDPKNVEYLMTLGGIYASSRKYPEAKAQYQKVMEADPDNAKVPLLLGIIEAESGQMEEGIKVLTKLTESQSDNVMAFFYRAKIYLEMEQEEKAKADLEKCLQLRPTFTEAGTALGMIFEKQGDVDGAIQAYSKIQANGRFKKRLAQLYLSKNEFEKALDEFREYATLEPDDYSVRVKVGLIYLELKRYQNAIEEFNSILKVQPDAGNVRFYLGLVYEEQKKWDLAVQSLKKVAVDSGFFKEATLHAAFILKEQNKMREGIEFTKQMLAKHPDIIEFYDMHASFFESQKDFKKAQAVLEQGLKKFPKEEKLLYFLGALQDKMGEKEKSISTMNKILEINPNNAHALNFVGYALADSGKDLEKAQENIEKALALRPSDGYIEDSLGWVLFKRGQNEKAIEQLQKAAMIQPEEAIIFEHLGDVYLAQKDYAKAVEMYKKASQYATAKKDSESVKKLEKKIASANENRRTPSAQ